MIKWKCVPDMDGLYEVSNQGEVRRRPSCVKRGSFTYTTQERLRKQCVNKANKRMYVTVSIKGKVRTFNVARLVAKAFIPISSTQVPLDVNHLNGNIRDNRVANLEWCTRSENLLHAVKTGLRKYPKGRNNPRSIGVTRIDPITGKTKIFPSITVASGNNPSLLISISKATRGIYKTANGYKWSINKGETNV